MFSFKVKIAHREQVELLIELDDIAEVRHFVWSILRSDFDPNPN